MVRKKINIIERQIDELVYKLYGLTEEEIKILEVEVIDIFNNYTKI